MDSNHGHLYVSMTEAVLDRADIVTLSSRWIFDKWRFWVKPGSSPSSLRLTGVDLGADIATRNTS